MVWSYGIGCFNNNVYKLSFLPSWVLFLCCVILSLYNPKHGSSIPFIPLLSLCVALSIGINYGWSGEFFNREKKKLGSRSLQEGKDLSTIKTLTGFWFLPMYLATNTTSGGFGRSI